MRQHPASAPPTTRCDLHVHSAASVVNDEWYTRWFDCPESYAEPLVQYELCRQRGMNLVTLTDHDTIEGGLQLLGRPGFFLSEEVTTRFPENDCVMHVLTWNITPEQHEVIQARRDDIYQLVDFLRREGIAHGLAHPLLSPNWRLDAVTVEKALLLFPLLERVNGLVDARSTPDLAALMTAQSPEALARLARKHDLPAPGASTAPRGVTAGSDDHTHRRCGTVFTEIDGADLTPVAFLERCTAGAGRPVGEQADLHAMALCVAHTAYHHLKHRQARDPSRRDPFVDVVDRLAGRIAPVAAVHADLGLASRLLASTLPAALAVEPPADLLSIPERPSREGDAHIVASMRAVSDDLLVGALGDLLEAASSVDIYRMLAAARDFVGAMAAAAPFLGAADHFGKQDEQVRRIWREWTISAHPPRHERLAIFSDSLEQVDGVSTWCRRFAARAMAAHRDVVVPMCGSASDQPLSAPFQSLPAATSFDMPLYPGMILHVPSIIGTVDWAWRQQISHVELATPGPMGLGGLLAARILRLPVTASYHTELPDLVQSLSGNATFAAVTRAFVSWFYRAVDRVFAFSPAAVERLASLGVDRAKIEIVPVAVDPEEFSPAHAAPELLTALAPASRDRPVILTVGRLSDEKNVPLMVEAVRSLAHLRPAPLLLVVGDGPQRRDLERRWADSDAVRFVGLQTGERLRQLYASARMFVFASGIDTLGLVNMEAMASGLPVLVPSGSSFAGLLGDSDVLVRYELGVKPLADAIASVLAEPARAARLAARGRDLMIDRWARGGFDRLWSAMTASS